MHSENYSYGRQLFDGKRYYWFVAFCSWDKDQITLYGQIRYFAAILKNSLSDFKYEKKEKINNPKLNTKK